MTRRLKHWGWGYEDEQATLSEQRQMGAFLASHLGFTLPEPEVPAPLPPLPPARLPVPERLRGICRSDDHDRALHALGRAYRDVVRGFRARIEHPPDVVAHPHSEDDVEAVLEWAAGAGAAVIPFGGGTSVVGGVEPRGCEAYPGVITLDLKAMDRLLELDPVSQAARIQAGATGPRLEEQLSGHGLTLRHYPQSFQFATLGGWLATRAAGHFATLHTHIEDLTESVRALAPSGAWESRRLPGSGAGPSPDRMLIGSEGILGVITEAWVRVRPRPAHRRSVGVHFSSFARGAEAVRAISQSGLYPAVCRLLDPLEARITGAGDGAHALLLLGFEAAGHDVEPWMKEALRLCETHGGTWEERAGGGGGGVSSWREAFLRAPYLRDSFVALGVISETFETAITWDRFDGFHAAVTAATQAAVREVCGAGTVTCRFTHVYPDGPAPYYTVLGPAQRGEELEQWAQIKTAASEAIIAAGGTITHHHAVGRDHRPWYDRQRPEPFAVALRAAKGALDPDRLLNPGVLIDP